MKAVVLSLLGLCLSGFTAQAQWVNQPITFANPVQGVVAVDAVDASTAWAIGDVLDGNYLAPQVARTTNGGQAWVVSNLPVNAAVREIVTGLSAPTPTTAWITTVRIDGAGGRVLRTSDGGQTWTTIGANSIFTSANSYPNFVHFYSATEGIVGGENLTANSGFEVYRTTDGGQSWTPVTTPPTEDDEYLATGLPTTKGNSIWLTTNDARVFRSSDRGQTWAVSQISTSAIDPTGLAFQDEQNGLVSFLNDDSPNHQLFRTTNGGQTWTPVSYSGPLHGIGLATVPGTNQYVSTGADLDNGDAGSSYSRDGGQTWVALENTTNHLFAEFVSPTVGWSGSFRISNNDIVGNGVNRFASSVLSARTVDVALQASLQLTPNPAEGGHATLRTMRAFAGTAQVRVLDVTGRQVRHYTWAGSTPLSLDLSRETAGLYLLEVESASGTARQKLVVR